MVQAQDLPDWAYGGVTPYNLKQLAASYTLAGTATQVLLAGVAGVSLKLFDGFIDSSHYPTLTAPIVASYQLAGSATQVLLAGAAGIQYVLKDLQIHSDDIGAALSSAVSAVIPAAGATLTLIAGVAGQSIYLHAVTASGNNQTTVLLTQIKDSGGSVWGSFTPNTSTVFTFNVLQQPVWLPAGATLQLFNTAATAYSSTVTITLSFLRSTTSRFTDVVQLEQTDGTPLFTYHSGQLLEVKKDFGNLVLPVGQGLQMHNLSTQTMLSSDRINLNYALGSQSTLTQNIQLQRTDGSPLITYHSGKGTMVPLSFRGLAIPAGLGLQVINRTTDAMGMFDHLNLNYLS